MTRAKLLDLRALESALDQAVAIRRIVELEPAGGPGDKVFPPTYEKGQYALERRRLGDRETDSVLLDSVQSQANRVEFELLRAWDAGRIPLPVVAVDFSGSGIRGVRRVTSLDAPHRLVDAILRDSEFEGTPFDTYLHERGFDGVSVANATLLYELCPTALVFGMWDSTGRRGGLGAKFQRAFVSEIVGLDALVGKRVSSRIDPLQIQREAAMLYEAKVGGWTLNPELAVVEKNKPKKLGKDGKPSEANHGNVTPSIAETGGVTISSARLTTVLSLAALRRLSFPDDEGRVDPARDRTGRVALAALALAGAALADASGHDLRSRCLLVQKDDAPWKLIGGANESRTLSPDQAIELLERAADAAAKAGLPRWVKRQDAELGTLVLRPQEKLVELVKRSQALEVAVGGDE